MSLCHRVTLTVTPSTVPRNVPRFLVAYPLLTLVVRIRMAKLSSLTRKTDGSTSGWSVAPNKRVTTKRGPWTGFKRSRYRCATHLVSTHPIGTSARRSSGKWTELLMAAIARQRRGSGASTCVRSTGGASSTSSRSNYWRCLSCATRLSSRSTAAAIGTQSTPRPPGRTWMGSHYLAASKTCPALAGKSGARSGSASTCAS